MKQLSTQRFIRTTITPLEATENYIASMLEAKGEQMSDAKAICSNTYAYYYMDDDE